MSRVFKPIAIPAGVELKAETQALTVKGGKGSLELKTAPSVQVVVEEGQVRVEMAEGSAQNLAMVGTTRALINNMITGVTQGFEKKLELVGVGYRAAAKGKVLNLTLGYSHPIDYPLPEGVTAETPSQTEIVVRGIDKHMVGQVAAEIREFRSPEPYKGKGIKYSDERIIRKEAKKK